MSADARTCRARDPLASDVLAECSTVHQAATNGIVERALGPGVAVLPAPVIEALARAGADRVLPEIPEAVAHLVAKSIRWLEAGHPVLPVVIDPNESSNSHSPWKKRPATEHGVDDATTDIGDLIWRFREGMRRFPPQPDRAYAIGVAWGWSHPAGGFTVSVDVDDKDLFASAERGHGSLSRDQEIHTQSGGRAYVGRSRNSHPTRTQLCGRKGVEWRQERAFSVVDGVTPDGREWKAPFDPSVPPPYFPEAWEELAASAPEPDSIPADAEPVAATKPRRRSRPDSRSASPLDKTQAEACAIAADLLQDPLRGADGAPITLKAHGLRRSRKGLATWLRCAPNGETLKAGAARHRQVLHAGIFAGQLARDEGLPPMEALGVLLTTRRWRELAAEPSDGTRASRAVDEVRTFVDGMRMGAKMAPRSRLPPGPGELVSLVPSENGACTPQVLDPAATVLAVVAAAVTGAISAFPAPSSLSPFVVGFDAPAWAASSTMTSLREAASRVHERLGQPTILRAHRPATEVVAELVGAERPCTVVTARRLLHTQLRKEIPGLRDLSDVDAVRGRGHARRVTSNRASLTVHAVARREVPQCPGLLVLVDAALIARTLPQMRERGIAALRVLRAHVAAGWGVVLADPHIDAETAHELLVALGANLGSAAWIDVEGARFADVDWLLAPTGGGRARISAHVHGVERVLHHIDAGEPVLLAVAAASNIDEFGRMRRFLADARPDTRVVVLDGNANPAMLELAEDADVVLASPAAFGLALQRRRHVIVLPAACPGLGAVDARRLLDLVHEPLSASVAPTYGGGGPIVDAESSAARHARARAHTRALADGHLPVGLETDVQLSRVLGRLRESMSAISWRQANVYDGLLGLLTAEGIDIRYVVRDADDALLDLAERLRVARESGEQARAIAISTAPDIGGEDAERLRRLPRWRLFMDERLALDKRDLKEFYPRVAWDAETEAFRLTDSVAVCPQLVRRDARGRHRLRVTRFGVADLIARGEKAAALTVARGELRDDGSTAEYVVEAAEVAIGILQKLTRGPADARLEDGLASWLASREWTSEDAELRAAMKTPEMAVLLHRAVVALRATWTPSSSVAQVVGDLLERLGVATVSTRPRGHARTYSVHLGSLREVDLLGTAERERMRAAASRLASELRPGTRVPTGDDGRDEGVDLPRRLAAGAPPG